MTPIIDWLTVTFVEVPIESLLAGLSTFGPKGLSCYLLPHGGNGFNTGFEVRFLSERFELVPLCRIFKGGEAQRGRMMVDFRGSGCGCVQSWAACRAWIETLPEARITRCDLAVDLLDGEHTVDDAVDWYKEGRFNVGGRNPSSETAGDWLDEKRGRTLYIGNSRNGKCLRVYEKGKQLGDLESDWNRFEVQFGSRDRVIPFEILTEPLKFFCGAYPALQAIMDADGEKIATISKAAEVVVGNVLAAMRRTYGKYFHLFAAADIGDTELVEAMRVRALPRRVPSSAVVCGVVGDTVKRSFDSWRVQHARR